MVYQIRTSLFFLLMLTGVSSAQFARKAPQFSPTIDGQLTSVEKTSQLVVETIWPMADGALIFAGAGFEEVDISATWYISWDETNLNIAADVWDNTPTYRNASPGPYNGQDAIQPVFNPFNNPDNLFVDGIAADDEVVDEVAAIYDIVFDTADEFGPHIYRHGHLLSNDEQDAIAVFGSETELGYILETTIPWSIAMDDVDPDYVPSLDDEHGLSFILISFNAQEGDVADIATLMTDFGEMENTIGDPRTWNSIKLDRPIAVRGDFNADGTRDIEDIDILWTAIQEGSIDLFFDLDGDDRISVRDYNLWVSSLRNTWFGDANLDSEFNSGDLVAVFQAGEFEDDIVGNSTWGEGDFNGDGDFTSSDFVSAFQAGGFEKGPRDGAHAVPEPELPALLIVTICFCTLRQSKKRGASFIDRSMLS